MVLDWVLQEFFNEAGRGVSYSPPAARAPRWNCEQCYRRAAKAGRHSECRKCRFFTAHYGAILRRELPANVVQCGLCADSGRDCPQCRETTAYARRLPYPDVRWFYEKQLSASRQQIAVTYFLNLPVRVRVNVIRYYYLRNLRLPPVVDILPPDEQRAIRVAYGQFD